MRPIPLRPLRTRSPKDGVALAAGRHVGELFEEHGRMVHALCRLMLRDRLDAEDAAQQTFLSAHRSLLGGVEPRDPPAWLATIARNECRARLAKRRIVAVPIEDSDATGAGDIASVVEQREEIAALAAALSELAPTQRDAVVLREFYGLSYAEVAAVLGVSGAAVESLLFKGRKRLQEKLGSLRVAGAVAVPDTLREALAQALPGFGGGTAAVGAGKLVTFPAAAKVAAAALFLAGGGVTAAETARRDGPRPPLVAPAAVGTVAAPPAAADAAFRPRRTSVPQSSFRPATAHRVLARTPARAADHEDEREEEQEDERDDEPGAGVASAGQRETSDDRDDDEREDDSLDGGPDSDEPEDAEADD